jgi:hypothetical protein
MHAEEGVEEEEGMCWEGEGVRLEELECRFAGPSEVRARLQLLVTLMAAAVLTVAAGRALGQQERGVGQVARFAARVAGGGVTGVDVARGGRAAVTGRGAAAVVLQGCGGMSAAAKTKRGWSGARWGYLDKMLQKCGGGRRGGRAWRCEGRAVTGQVAAGAAAHAARGVRR